MWQVDIKVAGWAGNFPFHVRRVASAYLHSNITLTCLPPPPEQEQSQLLVRSSWECSCREHDAHVCTCMCTCAHTSERYLTSFPYFPSEWILWPWVAFPRWMIILCIQWDGQLSGRRPVCEAQPLPHPESSWLGAYLSHHPGSGSCHYSTVTSGFPFCLSRQEWGI